MLTRCAVQHSTQMRECILPNEEEAERVGACREEAGAFLRAIPHNPKFLLSNGDFKGALAFRLGIPLDVLKRAGNKHEQTHTDDATRRDKASKHEHLHTAPTHGGDLY